MRSIGAPELFAAMAGVIGLCVYAVMFFVVWKFYQLLGKINENIAGIRQVMERDGRTGLPPSS